MKHLKKFYVKARGCVLIILLTATSNRTWESF